MENFTNTTAEKKITSVCDRFSKTYTDYDFAALKSDEALCPKKWSTERLNSLRFAPIETVEENAFAPVVTKEAIDDTTESTGLAVFINGLAYPVRDTAIKTILDRARINGYSLPKLAKEDLAFILNKCVELYNEDSLVLVQEQKVSAIHSGDAKGFAILPIPSLLAELEETLNFRFPGWEIIRGYRDHSYTACEIRMPGQKDDLLRSYEDILASEGKRVLADKLCPGLKFVTSDVGVCSVRVSAFLTGTKVPILVGSCIEVDHRGSKKVEDFADALSGVFVKFGDALDKLTALHGVILNYPVNAMQRICKHLHLPKKASMEVIAMFEDANGGNVPTPASDVYYAMQEILMNTNEKTNKFVLEENLSRALSLNWKTFDLAKPIEW